MSVAGAHLRGEPFHPALCRLGARFVRACNTAAKYRFYAFLDLNPPRPGLLRADERGGAVAVEIYDLPMEGFGRLVASVAPPLAIGTVELEDGELVKGFLCESCAARRRATLLSSGDGSPSAANRREMPRHRRLRRVERRRVIRRRVIRRRV